MPYGFVQDIASSWEQYLHFAAALGEATPAGLILHIAGPTDEGFRMIDVWESEEAWREFQATRLAPAIAALGGPSRPEPTFRDLHPRHVVVAGNQTWARSLHTLAADTQPKEEQ